MPRKGADVLQGQLQLPEPQNGSQGATEAAEKLLKTPVAPSPELLKQLPISWCVVGLDTSLTSIAAMALGFDAITGKFNVTHDEIRWTPETDYFQRLGDAARCHEMVLDLLRSLWTLDLEHVYIALEEPFPLGMLGRVANFQAGFAKQQAEVSGAVKGALVRYGFKNLTEMNNATWHKALRQDGAQFASVPRKGTQTEKNAVKIANKFVVRDWAIERYSLPLLPDLVKAKNGAKIPRPESGYGAKAQAIQASDVYDACAVMHAHLVELQERGILALAN